MKPMTVCLVALLSVAASNASAQGPVVGRPKAALGTGCIGQVAPLRDNLGSLCALSDQLVRLWCSNGKTFDIKPESKILKASMFELMCS